MIKYTNGNILYGYFKEGKVNGKGLMYFAEGSNHKKGQYYVGDFLQNQYQG